MSLPTDYNSQAIAVVPGSFDLTDGAETTFGRRWGGDVIRLSAEHLAALQAGQTLALDVQNEYVVFLQADRLRKLGQPADKPSITGGEE